MDVNAQLMDRSRFEAAPRFETYLEQVEAQRELWSGIWKRVRVPDDLVQAARGCEGTWHLVALSEDWCGDAANSLPVVARFAHEVGWDLRVLERDENLDLMDAHLTGGTSRSIPVVIVYDGDFQEVGWWGPRPRDLQEWVRTEGVGLSKDERYKEIRRFYAKDRGRATVHEILGLFCRRIGGSEGV